MTEQEERHLCPQASNESAAVTQFPYTGLSRRAELQLLDPSPGPTEGLMQWAEASRGCGAWERREAALKKRPRVPTLVPQQQL